MLKRILLAPDSAIALPEPPPAAPAPAPASPTPAAAPKEPAPAAAPEPEPSDDPFEAPKKPAAAPADKKPATPDAPVDFDKLAPKELRERVKTLNQEKQAFLTEKKGFEERIKAMEKRGGDTAALEAQLKAITDQWKAAEKERDGYQAELRAARQEASPEFKKEYDEPFTEAANSTLDLVNKINITNEDGSIRKADYYKDFAPIYVQYDTDPSGALEKLEEVFGKTTPLVLARLNELKSLDAKKLKALKAEKEQYKEKSNKEIAEESKRRGDVATMWDSTNKRLSETVSDYKNDPTDTEANDARKHALEVFDTSINAADREDFVKQKVLKDAHVRQRVGAYAVQKLVISRQKTEIETLKKQIEELKGTAPGGTHRPGGDATPADNDEDWIAGLIKSVKGA